MEQIIRMNFFQEIEILILNGDFDIELRKERKKENSKTFRKKISRTVSKNKEGKKERK